MDPAKQREIASMGGKMAHVKGTAHEWTSGEAREAGRKGGMASRDRSKQGAAHSSAVTEGMPPTLNQGHTSHDQLS
jgi:general stress protein YciG